MQTTYHTTSNFIQHTGNIVDLNEYRRKLAIVREGSLAPQPDCYPSFSADAPDESAPVLREVRPRRSAQRARRALWMDLCASACIVVMTLTFTVKVLML